MAEMTKERIEEIRARCEAATAGPWKVAWDSRPDIKTAYSIRAPDGGFMDEGQIVRAIKRYCSNYDGALGIAELAKYFEKQSDDAEFIAHARQDVPALLDALEVSRFECAETEIALAAASVEIDRLREIVQDDRWNWHKTCRVCGALFRKIDGVWTGNHRDRCDFAKTT